MIEKSAIAMLAVIVALAGICVLAGDVHADDGDEVADTEEGTVAEETDETADASVTHTVSYTIAGVTYTDTASTGESVTYTLRSIADIGASVPAGYSFAGWEDADGTIYGVGSTVTLTSDASYTATFTAITYAVSFVSNGATVSTVTGVTGATLTAPADPSMEGSIFAGWSLDGEEAVAVASTITADATYVALFTEDYSVTFIVDGTTILTTSVSQSAVPSDPSKDGFAFAGWEALDGTVYTSASIRTAVASIVEDAVFTAVWDASILTVTFVDENGTVLEDVTVLYADTCPEIALTPEREGYTFAGWVTEGGRAYDFGTAVTSDLVLVATYEAIPEPEATGLDDPLVLTLCVLCGFLLVVVIAVLLWKRKSIKAKAVKRLTESEGKPGEDVVVVDEPKSHKPKQGGRA